MNGKTVLVTGAASGIGAATAKLLTERGASVIAFDRHPVTQNCEQYIAIDLSNEASIGQPSRSSMARQMRCATLRGCRQPYHLSWYCKSTLSACSSLPS